MNKLYKIAVIFLLTLCILLACIILMLFGTKFFSLIHNPKTDEELLLTKIKSKTGIDFSSCELLSEENTHGGFLETGATQKIYNCYHQDIKKKSLKQGLKLLPLSKNLTEDIMANFPNDDKIAPGNIIPEITNGYYFFIDNYTVNYESNLDIYSDKNISNRLSRNYSLGVYDYETKIFYYFELDT